MSGNADLEQGTHGAHDDVANLRGRIRKRHCDEMELGTKKVALQKVRKQAVDTAQCHIGKVVEPQPDDLSRLYACKAEEDVPQGSLQFDAAKCYDHDDAPLQSDEACSRRKHQQQPSNTEDDEEVKMTEADMSCRQLRARDPDGTNSELRGSFSE